VILPSDDIQHNGIADKGFTTGVGEVLWRNLGCGNKLHIWLRLIGTWLDAAHVTEIRRPLSYYLTRRSAVNLFQAMDSYPLHAFSGK
jgi:hypothetical protein